MEVIEHSIKIRNPQDQNDDNQSVQDRFDLCLHGDEPVDNPQQKASSNQCDEDSGKWHIVFSIDSRDSIPPLASSGSYERSTHLAWEPSESGERWLRFTPILANRWRNV
jgi:hypothetical protein